MLAVQSFLLKVAPQELISKIVGVSHQQDQREADLEFVTVEDLLVRKEGDWLTMDDEDSRLKRQTKGKIKDPLLNNDETAIASNKSYSN